MWEEAVLADVPRDVQLVATALSLEKEAVNGGVFNQPRASNEILKKVERHLSKLL